MHAEVQLGDSRLFVNDVLPGMTVELPSPTHPCPAALVLYVPDVDATWKQAVAAGAKEAMGGLMDQYWGDRGGLLVDPFGYSWFVLSRVRDLTDDEIRHAQEQFMRERARRGAP